MDTHQGYLSQDHLIGVDSTYEPHSIIGESENVHGWNRACDTRVEWTSIVTNQLEGVIEYIIFLYIFTWCNFEFLYMTEYETHFKWASIIKCSQYFEYSQQYFLFDVGLERVAIYWHSENKLNLHFFTLVEKCNQLTTFSWYTSKINSVHNIYNCFNCFDHAPVLGRSTHLSFSTIVFKYEASIEHILTLST